MDQGENGTQQTEEELAQARQRAEEARRQAQQRAEQEARVRRMAQELQKIRARAQEDPQQAQQREESLLGGLPADVRQHVEAMTTQRILANEPFPDDHDIQDAEVKKLYNQYWENRETIGDDPRDLLKTRNEIAGSLERLSPEDAAKAREIIADLDERQDELRLQQNLENEMKKYSFIADRYTGSMAIGINEFAEINTPAVPPRVPESQDPQGWAIYKERQARQRQILDKIFNKLFSAADNQPGQEFNQVFDQLTEAPKLRDFLKFLGDRSSSSQLGGGYGDLLRQYQTEADMRQVLHNANYVVAGLRDTKALGQFLQGFKVEFADMAFSKVGVTAAMHLYEQGLRRIQAENGGYIPYTAINGDPKNPNIEPLDVKIERQLRELSKTGVFGRRELEDWEINRALAFARGMGVVFGTTLEILAQTKLPPGTEMASLYGQDIIKHLSPFQHVIGKFGIGNERLALLGFKLMQNRNRWSPKELQQFKGELVSRAFNGFLPPEEERFLSDPNPFNIGGVFSKTGWRIGTPNEINPLSALSGFDKGKGEYNYIGTGIRIERLRGDLSSHDHEKAHAAREEFAKIIKQITQTSPLKLFYRDVSADDPKVRINLKAYMQQLGINIHKDGGKLDDLRLVLDQNPWLSQALDDVTVMQEEATRLVDRDGKKEYNRSSVSVEDIKGDVMDGDQVKYTQAQRRENAQKLVDAIRHVYGPEKINAMVEDIARNPQHLPFIFGTEDLPYNAYEFTNLGGTAIARRWRDIQGAVEAGDALTGMIMSINEQKDFGSIIQSMHKIYSGISNYDESRAREFTQKLAQGVIDFHKKAWWAELPLVELVASRTGKTSYAQLAFGKHAMAWDAQAIHLFVEDLHKAGMLTHHQVEELFSKVGGSRFDAMYAVTRKVAPILALAFFMYIFGKTLNQK